MKNEATPVFAHLKKVLQLIEDDLVLALEAYDKANRGGHMAVSREVFCYVDYLGTLAYGGEGNLTENAVRYMETYFVKAKSAYSGKCWLIYNMWRHGTVHEIDAKVYRSRAKHFELGWLANSDSHPHNRMWHLACLCNANKRDAYFWTINLFELVDDLKASVKHFIRDLKSNPEMLERTRKNLENVRAPEDLDATGKKGLLLSEADKVIDGTAGIADEHGTVVHKFTHASEFKAFKKTWER